MDPQSPSNSVAADLPISTWKIHDRKLVLHSERVLPDKVRIAVDATLAARPDGGAHVTYTITANALEPERLVRVVYADEFTVADFKAAKDRAEALLTERCNSAVAEVRAANAARTGEAS